MEIDGVSYVALRKESVDRNSIASASFRAYTMVALRKESVDRNLKRSKIMKNRRVALRKESVDRNGKFVLQSPAKEGRSPQGERG